MDYIYGKLNKEVEKVAYKGGTTSSAQVSVDNSTNTIYVDTNSGIVDSYLSKDSTNPVQNKVITTKVSELESGFIRLNEQVVNRLVAYNDEIDSIADTVTNLSKDFSSLSEGTSSQISDILTKIEATNNVVKELQESSVTGDIENAVEKNTLDIGVLNDTTNKAIIDLKNEDEKLRVDISDLFDAIDSEHIERINALRGIDSHLNNIQLEIEDLSTQISNNDVATSEELESLSTFLLKKIEEVKQSITDVSQVCLTRDNELADQINALKLKDDELSSSIEDIKLYVNQTISNTTNQDIETLKTDISIIRGQLTALQLSYRSSVDDIFAIMQKLKEHEEQIVALQSDVSDVRNQMIVSVGQLDNKINRNYITLNDDIDTLNNKVGEVDLTKKGSLADQINELHGHLVVALSQLDDIQADITDEVRESIDKISATGVYVLTELPLSSNVTYVYASTNSGNKVIRASMDALDGNIVIRNTQGNVKLPASTEFSDTDAVHKQYVDNLIDSKTSDLEDAIMDIMNERFLIIDGGTSADLIKN